MSTLHWSSLPFALRVAAEARTTTGSYGETMVVSGRLLGDETPVETELTREGDDYEIVGRMRVPTPPRVRSVRQHAPILPPPRRSLATQ